MILRQNLTDRFGIDSGQPQKRWQQIDVTGQVLYRTWLRKQFFVPDNQRHVDRLLVSRVPLLVHTKMRTEQVAVVGEEDDDGVVFEPRVQQRLQYGHHL